MEKIEINQPNLDLFETSREGFLQSSCKKWLFIEFKLIVSTNSTVFQPLPFRNLKIFLQPMVAWLRLFACLDQTAHVFRKSSGNFQNDVIPGAS